MLGHFDRFTFLRERDELVQGMDDSWFKVPFRNKEEGLVATFGDQWRITYVPLDVDFVLDGYLLTHLLEPVRMLSIFQDHPRDWYDPANAPHNQSDGIRWPCGRVRERRATLRRLIKNVTVAPDLPTMIRHFADITVRGVNPQSHAYAPALFQVLLNERGISGPQADAERMLAGLSNYDSLLQFKPDLVTT